MEARERSPRRWRDVWSAGHSVSGVQSVLSVAELVAQTEAQYQQARAELAVRLAVG